MSGYLQKPSSGSPFTGVTVDGITVVGDGLTTPLSAIFTQGGKYMISGGITWSGTGLTYDVSFLNYFFNGNKTANPTQVTLTASDPTDNRFDAIVVDEAGTVTAITGTPSANPEVPAIPEDQLQVTIILVAAGSTTPTIASEEIYMDDPTTGWTFSTYQTATPTGSINFAGTSSPKQGTECIEASTDARLGARFVRGTSFDAFQYTMLQVWVRFTGTAVATNKSLNVRFENSAGTLVANTVNLFNYGLQRGVLNTWQLVVVPITAFGALPATVKGLKMIMAGGTVGQVRQWDIDFMILTNGSVPYANVPTIAFYKDNVGIASQPGLNLIQGTGVTITALNNPTNNRVDYTINASGSPISVGTASSTLYSSGLTGTGQGDTSSGFNIIFGTNAGNGASNVYAVNFLGNNAGKDALDAFESNFFGFSAGQNATSAYRSNFLGRQAGQNATYASNSQFIGYKAGASADNATSSIFIGSSAGTGDSVDNLATITYSALTGTFIPGESISQTDGHASATIGSVISDSGTVLVYFANAGVPQIGWQVVGSTSGATATIDSFTSPGTSILIGNSTSTGGFSNSIAIGKSATNTATNQMIIGSSTSPIDEIAFVNTGGNISTVPLSIKVTVPSADLLAVVTGPTPYQLIPAPGAGKFIDVISMVCNLNFNTTAYDFNNALRIGTNTTGSTYMGTDGGQLTISPYNLINASATKLSVVGSGIGEKNVNTALYLNAGTATTVTTGDSDIDLYITYKIVTL